MFCMQDQDNCYKNSNVREGLRKLENLYYRTLEKAVEFMI